MSSLPTGAASTSRRAVIRHANGPAFNKIVHRKAYSDDPLTPVSVDDGDERE
jgi:hypothetical protein